MFNFINSYIEERDRYKKDQLEQEQTEQNRLRFVEKHPRPNAEKVHFSSTDKASAHRRFLSKSVLTVNAALMEPVDDIESCFNQCDKIYEWSALQHVPERGDGVRYISPKRIAWNTQGDKLITASDAMGLSVWDMNGNLLGGETPSTAYGYPVCFFAAPDKLDNILMLGETVQNNWWNIHDKKGKQISQLVGRCSYNFGIQNLFIHSSRYKGHFTPWQPNSNAALLCVSSGDELTLLDASLHPPGGNFSDFSVIKTLKMSNLGPQCKLITRFEWHPSGEYVAVTMQPDHYNYEGMRTFIIHFQSGEIVDSTPPSSILQGWTPDGRSLVYVCIHNISTPANRTFDPMLWQCSTGETRKITNKEASCKFLSYLLANIESCLDSNLDLEVIANSDGTIKAALENRYEEKFDLVLYATIEKNSLKVDTDIYDIAWSPTDPLCFATVADGNVRVWKLKRKLKEISNITVTAADVDNKLTTHSNEVEMNKKDYHSCFISYSTADVDQVNSINEALENAGVSCWFAPKKMQPGQKMHEQLYRGIEEHDKLVIILSENSMNSEWVKTELRRALQLEKKTGQRKLFPIRLVNFEQIRSWECFDADLGKDLAVELRTYFIPGFHNIDSHADFSEKVESLIQALRKEPNVP